MKKAVTAITIISLVWLVLGGVLYALLPIFPVWLGVTPVFPDLLAFFLSPFMTMGSWFDFTVHASGIQVTPIIILCCLGVFAIIFLVWFIVILVRKRYLSLLVWLYSLFATFATLYAATGLFLTYYDGSAYSTTGDFLLNSVYMYAISGNGSSNLTFVTLSAVFVWSIISFIGLALVLSIVAFILDLVLISRAPAADRRVYASADDDRLVLVRDEPVPAGPSTQEIRELLHDELSGMDKEPAPKEKAPEVAPIPQTVNVATPTYGMPAGISGPLLVQYINTYGPQPAVQPYPPCPPCPPHEPPHKEEPPVHPEPPAAPKEKPVAAPVPEPVVDKYRQASLEAIRKAMHDELTDVPTTKTEPSTVLPPEPVEDVETPRIINVGPSLDEIRAIIRDELKSEEKAPVIVTVPSPAPVPEEPKVEPVKEEEPVAPTPVVEEEKQPAITLEDIRRIVAEEMEKRNVYHVVQETKVVEKEVVKSEPTPTVVAEPVVEEAPIPVVVSNVEEESDEEPAPEKEDIEKPKIIRIAFEERMKDADRELKNHYNELKSEILSYGVNSRVSNSGDTFRLHRKTYVKITIAGKSLKLYLALDPKDYENTTLPIQDAGNKGIYVDIPLVFKVKSELSLRRAKQLIADVMEKDGLEQGKIEPYNWVKELTKNVK